MAASAQSYGVPDIKETRLCDRFLQWGRSPGAQQEVGAASAAVPQEQRRLPQHCQACQHVQPATLASWGAPLLLFRVLLGTDVA